MSSYLSTLVARALQRPQPIRPRLASLFEPVTVPRVSFREVTLNKRGSQQSSKSIRHEEQNGAAHKAKSLSSTIRPEIVVTSSGTKSLEVSQLFKSSPAIFQPPKATTKHFDRPTSRPTESRVEIAKQGRTERPDHNALILPAPEPIKQSVQVAQAITFEEANIITTAPDVSPQHRTQEEKSQQAQASCAQAIVVKPEARTAPSEQPFSEPQIIAPDLPPSVRITIGRVEVRAIMPPTPTTVVAAGEPAMKALSLEQYLKQRNGDQR
jgi:hypothetical protein